MKYKDNFGVEDGVYSLLIYFYKKKRIRMTILASIIAKKQASIKLVKSATN